MTKRNSKESGSDVKNRNFFFTLKKDWRKRRSISYESMIKMLYNHKFLTNDDKN